MTMTKGKAFLICLIGIMVIFLSVFAYIAARKMEPSLIPVGACVAALCSITGGYIGFQVANNGVKGHNWSQSMYDSENPKEGEGEKR